MESRDITERLQAMADYLNSNSPIVGIDWKVALLEAKAEIERLRNYERKIKMACRW